MEEKKRLSHIDLLESIAILFVILYHSTLYFFDITKDAAVSNYLLYFGRTILSTCVPLFFFTNGYLLFNRTFNLRKHIFKIIRIILLIFVWAFLLMPVYLLIDGEPLKIGSILSNILYLTTDSWMNFFWFLGALICIYILFPALKALFDTNKKTFVFLTVACALLTFGFVLGNQGLAFLSALFKYDFGQLNYPLFTMFNPFRGSYGYSFVYFCVGGLVYTHEDKILEIKKVKRNIISGIVMLISCTFLFLVGVFYSLGGTLWDVIWNGYDTVFTFFNVLAIYVLCLSYTKNNKLIKNISCNTLGIYFIHGLLIRLTHPLLKSYDVFCNLPSNIIYAVLILLVSLLICLLFKKIPLLKKLV